MPLSFTTRVVNGATEIVHSSGQYTFAGEVELEMLARIAELEAALLTTRQIVCDAAMTGFNPLTDDWAERLYKNNGAITNALRNTQGAMAHERGRDRLRHLAIRLS